MYVCEREREREKERDREREFALRNGPADTFFSSQMGYISIPSSAAFLMK